MKLAELSENRAINNLQALSSRLRECRSARDTARSIRESFAEAYAPAALLMLTTR